MVEPNVGQPLERRSVTLAESLLGVLFGGSLFYSIETIFVWLASWPSPSVVAAIVQGFVGAIFSLLSLIIFGTSLSLAITEWRRLPHSEACGLWLVAAGSLTACVLPWGEYAKTGGWTLPYLVQLVAPVGVVWLYVVRLAPLVIFTVLVLIAGIDEMRVRASNANRPAR
ncbi:MAG TPA: hypothetical protein VNG90_02465 [Candidatus Acidoferrum sp.]|nr:hypothetical protein [Candidatus Acidoferrum sp.]